MTIDELKSKYFITQTIPSENIKDLARFITQPEVYAQLKDLIEQNNIEEQIPVNVEIKEPQFPVTEQSNPELFKICMEQGWVDQNKNVTEESLSKINSIQSVDFSNLENFDEFKFFTGVTTIKANAFSGCTKLKSISIPSNVTYIGKEAFKECVNLSSIHCYPIMAPTIVKSTFIDVGKNIETKILYYPKNSTGYDKWNVLIENNGFKIENCNID